MSPKIKKIWFYSYKLIRYSFLTTIYLFLSIPLRFSPKYKDLWIISERTDEARDNGYWLYNWLLSNKPNTNVRYVLAKKSADYEKMPRKDLIIEPESPQHYICHILSSYSISTHMHGASPAKSFCIPFLPFMRKKKTIFLQHGITQNAIKLRGKLDTVITASDTEKDAMLIKNPKYKDKIKTIGFCRYDTLLDESDKCRQKVILIMPTFRKSLRDIARLKDGMRHFKKTKYYKCWNNIINSEKLEKIAEDNNAKIIFFPHKEMQLLARAFNATSKRVVIGKPGEFDIQDLLKKAKILITDYSSVAFDFVYMNKPIVYYQFDQEDFYNKHYASSGRPYPFGDICITEKELLTSIDQISKHEFRMKEIYEKEASNFFRYRDSLNCERTYNEIKNSK